MPVKLSLLLLRVLLWSSLGIPLPRTRRVEPLPIAKKGSPSVSWMFLLENVAAIVECTQRARAGMSPEQRCAAGNYLIRGVIDLGRIN
jgi:hypothetical protein